MMDEETPTSLSPDPFYERHHGKRFTVKQVEAFLVSTNTNRCPHCGGAYVVEASVHKPEFAFMGGLDSPPGDEVLLNYAVTCVQCATLRLISVEVIGKIGRNA